VDLDADGFPDILSGSYSRHESPMAGTFQVLMGSSSGFAAAKTLNGNDGSPLVIPYDKDDGDAIVRGICTRPFAVDWDGDGHLDILSGNFEGSFYWFRGTGKGGFEPGPSRMTDASGDDLHVPMHSDPFVVDWDGDGDLDILSGSADGGVFLAENTAGSGKAPALTAFRPLIPAAKAHRQQPEVGAGLPSGPSGSTRVWAADVDGDGKLDILLGDSVTLLHPAEGVSLEDARKGHAAIQEQYAKLAARGDGEPGEEEQEKLAAEYSRLYEESKKFVRNEMTGHVWLYRRK
jgi:hypothetical protein